MDVRELRPGLWRCALPHPEWTPEEAGENGWEEIVTSYAIEASGGPVLFDPLAPLPSPELHRALVAGDVLLTHGEPVLTGAVDALARALEPHSPPSA